MEKTFLRKVLKNPIFNLITACILIYLGLSEIWSTLLEDFRSHHLVSFCGFWHLAKAGLDLYDGKEQFGKFFNGKKKDKRGVD